MYKPSLDHDVFLVFERKVQLFKEIVKRSKRPYMEQIVLKFSDKMAV